jgi:hypothetical protein
LKDKPIATEMNPKIILALYFRVEVQATAYHQVGKRDVHGLLLSGRVNFAAALDEGGEWSGGTIGAGTNSFV